MRRWFWCSRYPIALSFVHSWSRDLARFLVRSESDSIELRGLRVSILIFTRFLMRSESDSIELRGLRESILRSLFLHAEDPSFLGLLILRGFWCSRNPIA